MAFYDAKTYLATAQAITSTATSATGYDVTGAGAGTTPSMVTGNTAVASFGMDIGLGDGVATPQLLATIGTAFTTAGSATLQIAILASPSSNNLPTGYNAIYTSQAFSASQLVAGAQLIAPVPPYSLMEKGEALPRFYLLNFIVAGGSFSAGTISGGFLLNPGSGLVSTLYAANFLAA